jgi:hypothetical protein
VRCDLVLVIPGADRQRVADENPAGRRLPRRGQDVRARLVEPRRRVVDPEGPEPKASGLPVEQATEHLANRTVARRASRSLHRALRARRCGSWTETRNRRSAGTARVRPHSAPGAPWLPCGQPLWSWRRSSRLTSVPATATRNELIRGLWSPRRCPAGCAERRSDRLARRSPHRLARVLPEVVDCPIVDRDVDDRAVEWPTLIKSIQRVERHHLSPPTRASSAAARARRAARQPPSSVMNPRRPKWLNRMCLSGSRTKCILPKTTYRGQGGL